MRAGCIPTGSETHPIRSMNPSGRVRPVRRGPRLTSVAGLGVVFVAGCGSMEGGGTEGEFESDCSYLWASDAALSVSTWWKSNSADCRAQGGEACAAQAIEQGYSVCTPGGQVDLVTKSNKGSTLTSIEELSAIVNGAAVQNPPEEPADGAIVNGGADVFRLARCQYPNETPKLASLGTLDAPAAGFLVERTPEELRHLVTCRDGRLWGMVLGLHRLNQLFYNRDVMESEQVKAKLAARGVNFAATHGTGDFLVVLEALAEADYEHPLAISDDAGSWSRFLIENIMVALGPPDLHGTYRYTHFWSGLSEKPQTATPVIDLRLFEDTLEFARKVAKYVTPVPDAMASITLGQDAVFTVTGDWEVPKMGPELGTAPFPGTEHAYVYSADVAVATTKHGATLDATSPILGWFKSVTSTSVQSQFAPAKYALSPVVFDGNTTRAKRSDELFTVDGQPMQGIAGLLSYVPYLSFDYLGPNIRDYMLCLVNAYAENPSEVANTLCTHEQDALTQYVFKQYCSVLTGTTSGCQEFVPPKTVIK